MPARRPQLSTISGTSHPGAPARGRGIARARWAPAPATASPPAPPCRRDGDLRHLRRQPLPQGTEAALGESPNHRREPGLRLPWTSHPSRPCGSGLSDDHGRHRHARQSRQDRVDRNAPGVAPAALALPCRPRHLLGGPRPSPPPPTGGRLAGPLETVGDDEAARDRQAGIGRAPPLALDPPRERGGRPPSFQGRAWTVPCRPARSEPTAGRVALASRLAPSAPPFARVLAPGTASQAQGTPPGPLPASVCQGSWLGR